MEQVTSKLRALVSLKSKKEFTPDMFLLFMEALEGYTPQELAYGIKKCSQTNSYGITPFDILVHLKPTEHDIRARASMELSKVIKSIQTGNSSYYKGDPVTEYLLSGRWKLSNLEDKPIESMPFFEKEFIQEYLDCSLGDDIKEHIKLGKGMESKLLQAFTIKSNRELEERK